MEEEILECLKGEEFLTITHVAERVGIERHTAAKYLRSMEEKGILKKEIKGRSKCYSISNTRIFDFLQQEGGISEDVKNLLSQLPVKISIQDDEYNIIYSDMEETGKKCYEAYAGREDICPNCPAERTLKTGRSSKDSVASLDKKVTIKPVKNQDEDTIGVIEIMEE